MAQTPQQQMATIKDQFLKMTPKLAELLPRHMTPDRMVKVALNCVAKTPKLQECSLSSLLQCLVVAAELGLEPGGALGHLYLVPFKGTCTVIIGYRGLIELARRSGQLAQIEAHVVHENDEFAVEFGLNPVMRHKPQLRGEPGKPVLTYMIARLKDGSTHIEVMTQAEVERIKARSRSAADGPWVTDPEEMAKKTVLRRGSKYLPLATEQFARAAEIDDEDAVDGQVVNRGNQGALPEGTASLAQEIAAPSAGNEKAKAALKAKAPRLVVEVAAGQTEAEAIEAHNHVTAEPPDDVPLQGNVAPI